MPARSLRLVSRSTSVLLVALLAATTALSTEARAGAPKVIVVPGAALVIVLPGANLADALVPSNAGRVIRVVPGDYTIDGPLVVPRGATLQGPGAMTHDEDGLPSGFAGNSAPRIVASRAFPGNLLTLQDGATLRGLQIDDLFPGRGGNTVAVQSTIAGDSLAAAIVECDLGGAGPSAASPSGPIGRVVRVLTLTGHGQAHVALDISGSRLRAAGTSSALFAVNFGNASEIEVHIEGSNVLGQVDSNGGVPRPTIVEGARVTITSVGNVYRRDGDPNMGWYLHGGSDAPIANGWPGARGNTLRMISRHDRIEGFAIGILGIGGHRFTGRSTASTGNRLELDLADLTIATPELGSDFVLIGALSSSDWTAGDDNVVHLVLRDSLGSGPRDNFVAAVAGPLTAALGVGNRVEIAGSQADFEASNTGFEGGTPLAPFFLD